jgi:hypothetical protein
LNGTILGRKCHEWSQANNQEADTWMRWYLAARKYAQLIEAVTNPDPMLKNEEKSKGI